MAKGYELTLFDILISVVKHRWAFIVHLIIITAIAVTISLLMPKYYKSEVVFIPKGPSGLGSLGFLGNNFNIDMLSSQTLSKRQYEYLLYSRELRENLIRTFDLIALYKNTKKPNPLDQTLKDLENNIIIEEEEEGGLGITDVIWIKLMVIDKNPKRAAEMANFLYEMLEQRALALNRSEFANVSRFLEQQMDSCTIKLEQARLILNSFQKTNHIYDIPQQVSMVLQTYGLIKAELLSNQRKIEYMESIHSSDYDGITILKNKQVSLQKNLLDLELSERKDLYIGLNNAVNISGEYIDLLAEVETYTQLRLMLKQQLEQAKIKESRNFSGLALIDRARPAEYKFKPKRIIVVAGIVSVYMALLVSFFILHDFYRNLREHDPQRLEKFNTMVRYLRS